MALLTLALLGCGKSLEKDVVGTWTAGQQTLDLKEDKSFESRQGAFAMQGTWEAKDGNIRLATKTVGGQPLDQFVNSLVKRLGSKGTPKAKQDEMRQKALDQMTSVEVKVSEDHKKLSLPVGTNGKSLDFTKSK